MYKLSELHQDSYCANHQVAWNDGAVINWRQFVCDVNATRLPLRNDEREQWALFHIDTYCFAVSLIALLAQGKTIYLPGENHAGVTSDLLSQNISLMGQFPASECGDIIIGEMESPGQAFHLTGRIIIYTSGSTGAAKPIAKSLGQLDRELGVLEFTWGKRWEDPIFASTVSHQHFYGLLFSLLWPLCAGRRFCRRPFVDPGAMARATSDLGEAVWIMSPAHLHRLPQHTSWDDAREKVNTIFSSGGPLKYEAAQYLYQTLGRYPIEVLGSSETGGIAHRQQKGREATWQPLPEVEIRLNDQAALTVRSPWLEEFHWFETSDLATLCPGGTFKLGMRADRIVKLEGKRVALPEVESALLEHLWIDDTYVVVITRRRQVLGAVLVLSEAGRVAEQAKGRHLFTRELRVYLREQIATAAIPRLWRIVPNLPQNSQGKVLASAASDLFIEPALPVVLRQTNTDNGCSLEFNVERDSPYFDGHFPDQPVLPGVVQLLWAQHFAKQCLSVHGDFSGMKAIKFRDLVFPGNKLTLNLAYAPDSGRLSFHYDSEAGRHSQGILLYEEEA